MQKTRIAAVGIMAALAVLIAGGSVAYFTAETEASNVFTVGDVGISLTGANDYGRLQIGGSRNLGSQALTAQADGGPTVYVNNGSEKCWVFLVIDASKWKSMAMIYIQLHPEKIPSDLSNVSEAEAEEFIMGVIDTYYKDFNKDGFVLMHPEEYLNIVSEVLLGSTTEVYKRFVFGTRTPVEGGAVLKLHSGPQMPEGITSDMFTWAKNFTDPKGSFKMEITALAVQSENLVEEPLDEPAVEIPLEDQRELAYSMLGDMGYEVPSRG